MKSLQIILNVFFFFMLSNLLQADPDKPKNVEPVVNEKEINLIKAQYEIASSKDSNKENAKTAFKNLNNKTQSSPVDKALYYYIGLCYLNGYGTEINLRMAYDTFEKGGGLGNNDCLLKQAEMHKAQFEIASSKNSNKEDAKTAFKDLENKARFRPIDKEIYYYIGLCYLNGYGTQIDLEKAYETFGKGGEAGNKECLLKQEKMQKEQFEVATSKDSTDAMKKNAFKYLQNRSYQEKIDKEVYYYLGTCYLNGYGTTISTEDAYRVFSIWGKDGNSNCLLMQGAMHENEVSINDNKLDATEAIKYYEQAAALGNLDALKKLETLKSNNNTNDKFLLDTFGEAYGNISFGDSSESLKFKLLNGDNSKLKPDGNNPKPLPYETKYNGSEPYIWKNLNNAFKNKSSNLNAFSVINNFSPNVITYETPSYETPSIKLEFLLCEDKKTITNENIKKNELGLYFVSLKYKNIENNEILKKLKNKYQGIKESKTDLIINGKAISVLGVKELVLSIPTMTYQDDKINLIYYSLPKDITTLITIKNTPISELSENEIKFLTDQMQKYEKDMVATILAAKKKEPEKDIEASLKEQKIKVKFKDVAEFRDYTADLLIRDNPTHLFNSMIKELGLTLSSNVLYITSVKIQNLIIEESIKINNDK